MKTILVVDDNKHMQMLYKAFLEDRYRVLVLTDCIHILNFLENNKIDLIICDLALPTMNGWDCCAVVKAEYPDIKCVLISGLAFLIGDEELEGKLSPDAKLDKPFEKKDLDEIIENYIGA